MACMQTAVRTLTASGNTGERQRVMQSQMEMRCSKAYTATAVAVCRMNTPTGTKLRGSMVHPGHCTILPVASRCLPVQTY